MCILAQQGNSESPRVCAHHLTGYYRTKHLAGTSVENPKFWVILLNWSKETASSVNMNKGHK